MQEGGRGILFDGGPDYRAYTVEKYLQRAGINKLEAVYLSHLDANHYGFLEELLETRVPRGLYIPKNMGRSRKFEAVASRAQLLGVELYYVDSDEHRVWAGEVVVEGLPAGLEDAGKADDRSMVYRISKGSQSLLYMGGAGEKVEAALLEMPIDLGAPLLCAGNPVKDEMLTEKFLLEVRPREVVLAGRAWGGAPLRQDRITQRLEALEIESYEPQWGACYILSFG